MKLVSLNMRRTHDAVTTSEVELVLFLITHPDLANPIRLSTDPTERLSVEPLLYGTRSTWLTADGSPFLFALVSAVVPDDQDEAPMAGSLVIEAVDNRIVDLLRSTTEQASISMAVVLASSPNLVEYQALDMNLIDASGDAASITLRFSRDPLVSEPWPAARMTRSRFPGLHR